MNWTIVQGKWKQLKGELQSNWAKLTDDDIGVLDGKRETLVGKLVERYGVGKDEAENQIDRWVARVGHKQKFSTPDDRHNGKQRRFSASTEADVARADDEGMAPVSYP